MTKQIAIAGRHRRRRRRIGRQWSRADRRDNADLSGRPGIDAAG